MRGLPPSKLEDKVDGLPLLPSRHTRIGGAIRLALEEDLLVVVSGVGDELQQRETRELDDVEDGGGRGNGDVHVDHTEAEGDVVHESGDLIGEHESVDDVMQHDRDQLGEENHIVRRDDSGHAIE